MMTLVEFLTAQLDELEAAAKAAAELQGSRWTSVLGIIVGSKPAVGKPQGCDLWDSESGYLAMERATAEHCALHDPAFVLADVAAKRRIIGYAAEVDRKIDAEWGGVREAAELWADGNGYEGREILQLLALPFSSHPDYQQEWAV